MSKAFIYDAVRTPRGKGKKDGSLYETKAVNLLATVFRAIKERNDLDTSKVEDAIIGCVTQSWEQSGDIAKAAALQANYDDNVAGVTLNRFCGSGLEAINQSAAYIMSGQVDLLVAGGVESMSRVPMGSDGSALLTDPDMIASHYMVPQGISADLIATKFGYSRDTLDEFASESHKRASHAWESGRFERSIIPVVDPNGIPVLERDETVRPLTTPEVLAGLNPAFEQMGSMAGFDDVAIQRYPEVERINHVHHAGNSSGIVDGAGLVLMGSEEIGKQLGLTPRAQIKSFGIVGAEPTIMLEGPAPASRKALAKAGMDASDIDLFEINEAFAVVPMRLMEELKVSHDKLNVNGGAIAMGHPLGATGSIITGTLLDELERQDKTTGLISLCIGGGMGIATIIERV
ncbi:MAG: acetyl-CoA C-acetyltransferase [Flavobacteriales bacterium]|nr:acetyl-CoA C-acetyltransferase [Flavobacteriales bacterium]